MHIRPDGLQRVKGLTVIGQRNDKFLMPQRQPHFNDTDRAVRPGVGHHVGQPLIEHQLDVAAHGHIESVGIRKLLEPGNDCITCLQTLPGFIHRHRLTARLLLTLEMESQHRDIVCLFGLTFERMHTGNNRIHQRPGVRLPGMLQQVNQSCLGEQLATCAGGFSHSVGKQQQRSAGLENNRVFPVSDRFHGAGHRAVSRIQAQCVTVRINYIRWAVTGVGVGYCACVNITHRHKQRHEHAAFIIRAQYSVYPVKYLRGRLAAGGRGFDKSLGHRHEQRGRDTLSRHITDTETQFRLVQKEEVVEITTQFARGFQACVQGEAFTSRTFRKILRHHTHLDIAANIQLGFHAIFLCLDGGVGGLQFLAVLCQSELCFNPRLEYGG